MQVDVVCQPDPHRYRTLAPAPPEGPLDLAGLLPGAGSVELEIGFGHGSFLYERAAARPDVKLFGLEIKKKWSYLVAERCRRRGLANVVAWGADAREVLPRVPAASVARVFMHFPDPWWKKRHHKRRLFQPELCEALARTLTPGGTVYVVTDVVPVFREIVENMEAAGFRTEPWERDDTDPACSSYERKYRQQGRQFEKARFVTRGI